MSQGSNGLTPIRALSEKSKCPEAPTKRKYLTSEEAWKAAEARTAESGIDIAPYACPGCGSYHLTKKVTGSDVLTRQKDGKVVTGAQRKHTEHPVYSEPPERAILEPLVPGNRAARVKALARLLEENPSPRTDEVAERLFCSTQVAREIMREEGFEISRGPGARWVRRKRAEEPDEPEERWVTVENMSRISHMALGDLVAAYSAAGIMMRVQVQE